MSALEDFFRQIGIRNAEQGEISKWQLYQADSFDVEEFAHQKLNMDPVARDDNGHDTAEKILCSKCSPISDNYRFGRDTSDLEYITDALRKYKTSEPIILFRGVCDVPMEKMVEARCHPEDDWRLQVGIDELKERMADAKKPREIKVGDKVRFVFTDFYNPNKLCDFFDNAKVTTYDILRTTSTALSGGIPNKAWRYEVLYVGDHLDSSINKNVRVALVRHEKTDVEFVVRLEKLELVE